MENTIKIGLLGCGRVAHNHIEAIGKCKGAEVTAVAGGSHAKEFGGKIFPSCLGCGRVGCFRAGRRCMRADASPNFIMVIR